MHVAPKRAHFTPLLIRLTQILSPQETWAEGSGKRPRSRANGLAPSLKDLNLHLPPNRCLATQPRAQAYCLVQRKFVSSRQLPFLTRQTYIASHTRPGKLYGIPGQP